MFFIIFLAIHHAVCVESVPSVRGWNYVMWKIMSTVTANCKIFGISLSEPEVVNVGQQKNNDTAIDNQPISKIQSQHVSRQAFKMVYARHRGE